LWFYCQLFITIKQLVFVLECW